jgi:cytochrome c553
MVELKALPVLCTALMIVALVSKRFDDQDIAAVAAYFQQVDASTLAATQPTK